MKTVIILIIAIISIYTTAYGQTDKQQPKANYYLQKATRQNKTAWILLGGGAVITGIGIATFPADYSLIFYRGKNTERRAAVGASLIVAGGLSMLGSIPFFIASGRNKTIANLSIGTQKTAYGLPDKLSQPIAGINLSITIGK